MPPHLAGRGLGPQDLSRTRTYPDIGLSQRTTLHR